MQTNAPAGSEFVDQFNRAVAFNQINIDQASTPDYRLLRPTPATTAGNLGANTAGGKETLASVQPNGGNTEGVFNTAFGWYALNSNTIGIRNTAFGSNASQNNNIGDDNIAVGVSALLSNTNGNGNIAIGREALKNCDSPDANICIGTKAGETIGAGGSNIVIGHEANVDDSGRQRCVVLGRSAVSPAVDGSLAIGGTGGNVMGNLNVATAGGTATGEYLNIYINGVQRKIALLLP